jgi:hypothetical protein
MSTARVEADIAVRSVGTDRLSAPSVAFAQRRRAKRNLNWKWIRSASVEMERRRFTFIAI